MLNEIQSLKKRIVNLERNNLDDIVLNSEFNVLGFYGQANGAVLTKTFDDSVFRNKNVLLKGLKVVPYYNINSVDLNFSDGTTETIPLDTRINRIFDSYAGATASFIRFLVNGAAKIFNVDNTGAVDRLPSDYEIDNVFVLYKNVTQMNIECFFENLSLGVGTTNPLVKIYIQCYTFANATFKNKD